MIAVIPDTQCVGIEKVSVKKETTSFGSSTKLEKETHLSIRLTSDNLTELSRGFAIFASIQLDEDSFSVTIESPVPSMVEPRVITTSEDSD